MKIDLSQTIFYLDLKHVHKYGSAKFQPNPFFTSQQMATEHAESVAEEKKKQKQKKQKKSRQTHRGSRRDGMPGAPITILFFLCTQIKMKLQQANRTMQIIIIVTYGALLYNVQ